MSSIRRYFTTLAAGLAMTGFALGATGCGDSTAQADTPNIQNVSHEVNNTANDSGEAEAERYIPGMENGTTKAPRDMFQAFTQEGHILGAQWKRIGLDFNRPEGEERVSRDQFITVRQDLDGWYVIASDVETGQRATELTVVYAGTDVKLYDVNRTDMPTLQAHNFDRKAAQKDIKDLEDKGFTAHFYDDAIQNALDTHDARVIFEGRVYNHATGQDHGFLTIVDTPSSDQPGFLLTLDSGASFQPNSIVSLALTDSFKEIIEEQSQLDNSTQVASNTSVHPRP